MATDTKQRILQTAIRLFADQGYDVVSMRMIAREVGLSSSSLYSHFDGKKALLDGVIGYLEEQLEYYEPSREEILRQLGEQSPAEILRRYITFYTREDRSSFLQLYRLMHREQYQNERLRDVAHRFFIRRPVDSLAGTLDLLVEAQAIPLCDSRALAEMWARTSLVYGMIASHGEDLVERGEYLAVGEFLIQMAVRGVHPIPRGTVKVNWRSRNNLWKGPEGSGTRGAILLGALRLFSERGYNSVSVRDIAAAVGIQGGSIYSHFAGKSEIMKAIVDGILDNFDQYKLSNPAFRAVFDTHDPQRIAMSLSSSYPPLHQDLLLTLYRILFREQYTNEELKDFFLGSIYKDRKVMAAWLEKLVEAKRIPPADCKMLAIIHVHTMCSMTMAATVFPPEQGNPEELRIRWVTVLTSLTMYGYLDSPPFRKADGTLAIPGQYSDGMYEPVFISRNSHLGSKFSTAFLPQSV